MKKRIKKILAVSGSSGGHIFPALGLLDVLKERFPDFPALLVLPEKNIIRRGAEADYRIRYIAIENLRFTLDFKNLLAMLNFLKGSLQTLWIIFKFRPQIVIAFGSLHCLPAVIWAKAFGIKCVIHEQNVIPGRANRFLAFFADKIAISFARSGDYFKKYRGKIVHTGSPLRKKLILVGKPEALDFFGFKKDKFTVLVLGGSQGSRSVNRGFIRAAFASTLLERMQIIHICGPADFALSAERYRNLSTDYKLFGFCDSMQYAYSAADLVISRAGATTISEIIFYKIPAILIPYPFAYSHQMENAAVLQSLGTAVIIKDEEMESDALRNKLEELIASPYNLKSMRSRLADIAINNAGGLLLDACLSLN